MAKVRLNADGTVRTCGSEVVLHSTNCCESCTKCDGNDAPQAWSITISGITNDNCTDCANYDGTYTLASFIETGGVCTWSAGAVFDDECSIDGFGTRGISLKIYQSGADFIIDVQMDLNTSGSEDLKWSKNYSTTKPDCDNLSGESLATTTDNSTECSNGSATCTITAL